MLIGVSSAIKNNSTIFSRLNRFVKNCPFSNTDILAFLSIEDRKKLKSHVAHIMEHRLDILGSGLNFMGNKIDWHQDFVTGFKWGRTTIYSDIRGLTPNGTDIKRPWELSRCQHFIPLGIEWRLSRQTVHLNEYLLQIEDWIKHNSVGYGVNWVCPMEVAIRSVNWLIGYGLLSEGLSNKKHFEFQKQLTISLWEHARFIRTHLEWNGPFSERRANHFLSNLTGLFTLGVFFSDNFFGRRWIKFSVRWLEKEIRRQILKDGVHFECSISYHRLCLEMFMWCYYLGKANDIKFSEEYKIRVDRMREFTSAYTRPDGSAPLFGDNDDGRLLNSGLGHINDHNYLWNDKLKNCSAVDAVLLSGNVKKSIKAFEGFKAFSSAGFFIINQGDLNLIVRAGQLAHLGTHAHCDQLSFELSIKGVTVFIDPGTYVYTSDIEKRNRYRSTQAHNVLSINHAEQNSASGPIFGYLDETKTEVLEANRNQIVARHRGFKALKRSNLSHTRIFRIPENEKIIEIFDIINDAQKGDLVEWFFHLSPGVNAVYIGGQVHIRTERNIVCELTLLTEMEVRIERFDTSPGYGWLENSQVMIFTKRINVENSFLYKACFKIHWRK